MKPLFRRNRLESKSNGSDISSTASDLSVLAQSLRDLSDWTDAMRAKLDSMGPIGGDELSIRKQQV